MEKIGIIGIGKLGLCFALNLEAVGYQVVGIDINPNYVDQLNARTLKSPEPEVETMLQVSRHFHAFTDWNLLLDPEINVIFVVVATPSIADGGYDHYQVESVLDQLLGMPKPVSRKELVIMCTTQPGYCDSAAARMAGHHYALSYNPEFIAQGRIIQDQQFPDQILIGQADDTAGEAIERIYRKVCRNQPTYHRMSRISAEITKLATNCFITTKISFANSIGALAECAGAEPDKILNAIGADSRIGRKYLGYGFGYGGPCFPRDNRSLMKFGRDQEMEMLIAQATDEVNRRHLEFMFQQWMKRYDESEVIVFDQVTYKPGTVILEESQQLALAEKLARAGRRVHIHEQEAVVNELKTLYGDLFSYEIRS